MGERERRRTVNTHIAELTAIDDEEERTHTDANIHKKKTEEK